MGRTDFSELVVLVGVVVGVLVVVLVTEEAGVVCCLPLELPVAISRSMTEARSDEKEDASRAI